MSRVDKVGGGLIWRNFKNYSHETLLGHIGVDVENVISKMRFIHILVLLALMISCDDRYDI